MKKTTLVLTLSMLIAAVAVEIGFCGTNAMLLSAKGKVTAVDTTLNTVNIPLKSIDTAFSVTTNTIFWGAKDLTVVKTGDLVKISYKIVDGKNIAVKLGDYTAHKAKK